MSIAELSAPTEIWQVIRGLYFAPNVGRAGFDRRQERENPHVLEAAAEAVTHRVERAHALKLDAIDEDIAGARRKYAADDIDDCRLAGAVRADAGRHLAGRDFDRHVLEDEDAAEVHRQPVDSDTIRC